jgi:glutamate formiminotransferase/formiminotetrahydrofolate cyclodeaminase
MRVLECVPNFSEGRDGEVIRLIAAEVEKGEGVKLLDVDPGKATNRTVVTFAGEPEAVVEAAMRLARKATELIDMRHHKGEHPRFGALDVCPLVPVSGITMEEAAALARKLARRLGEEVGLTVYCYEHAATREERRNLAVVRAGEYEGLERRLGDPRWKPDFGPSTFQERSGATAVGARDFLVAYNVNLNTTSTRRANAVAFDVRERGRPVADAKGETVWVPGALKCVKGIGWFIDEYGIAQVSLNLTNLAVTPLHAAFDEVCKSASARGMRVTGSEIVGLVPLQSMLDAGRHFLRRQQRSTGVSDRELIRIAIRTMGLHDVAPFDPAKKIVEYALAGARKRLVDLSLERFTEETASESVAPGGGSVAAALGAFGAALGTMVANLSSHKRGWDERWEEFSAWAEKGKAAYAELLALVDRDTDAFHAIVAARRMARDTDAEKAARLAAIEAATRQAIEVPLRVMEVALSSMEVLRAMVEKGNPNSVSDAAVGALCARSAAMGAFLNVRINAPGLGDRRAAAAYVARGERMQHDAVAREREILALADGKL